MELQATSFVLKFPTRCVRRAGQKDWLRVSACEPDPELCEGDELLVIE